MNVPFLRTFAFVHSWLADTWAMKKGCNHQFQCMQETWRQDAKNREQMTSLSEHEEIENLRFLLLVHRCNRQKKVSSVRRDKRGYVTVIFFRDGLMHIKYAITIVQFFDSTIDCKTLHRHLFLTLLTPTLLQGNISPSGIQELRLMLHVKKKWCKMSR